MQPTTIKALIADDEAQLRTYLRRLLGEVWPELEICAEAGNGQEAVVAVERCKPAVAFLDIRMPGFSGLQVAERIAASCHIVFVTAYDDFAVEAFEQEAVDYLLNPVARERLVRTELDPDRFCQIHRGTIVNLSQIEGVSRSLTGRGVIRLKHRPETLVVSRSYLHFFKQM